ncbi:alpha/beta fold hydrolase [Agarivorans aestuarii]|uniref:Alpha/beta fold hydrolase n=1 Tax=Agarivorans aestuarii TaxID=1563703 RepID=A0ABU7G4D4_9ALTE|nr:alpha/beta fold hydrolase [Agarivorans aestuarii]MEE1674117.1 alpha/beta fold hydrolase [Agarivorans aestuarii]
MFVRECVLRCNAKIAFVLLLASTLLACKDVEQSSELLNSFEPEFVAQWQKVVEASEPPAEYSLQAACTPQVIEANPQLAVKGTIIMVHGFTACNQQFFDWGLQLAAAGYHVVLPALPGHGLVGEQQDLLLESSGLANSAQVYSDFADQLVLLGQLSPGPSKIIAGLSVGGAVAAAVAIRGEQTFDKALLMAPFLAIPMTYSPEEGPQLEPLSPQEELDLLDLLNSETDNSEQLEQLWQQFAQLLEQFRTGVAQSLLALLKLSIFIPQLDYNWGPDCEDERMAGRAGICNFKISNLFAVDSFGRETLEAYQQADSLELQIQLVAVENDNGADPLAIQILAERLNSLVGEQASGYCLYDGTIVPHSFISKYDNIVLADEGAVDVHSSALANMEALWLSRFYSEAMEFIDSDTPNLFANEQGFCIQQAL